MQEKVKTASGRKENKMVNGFKTKDGQIYLVRCPKCKMENWMPAVSSGTCCWCGFNANKEPGVGEYSEE